MENLITINVGGTIFTTTYHTIKCSGLLKSMKDWNVKSDLFLDRDPDNFRHILAFMRDPRHSIPPSLAYELDYYQIYINNEMPDDNVSKNPTTVTHHQPFVLPISDDNENCVNGMMLNMNAIGANNPHHEIKPTFVQLSRELFGGFVVTNPCSHLDNVYELTFTHCDSKGNRHYGSSFENKSDAIGNIYIQVEFENPIPTSPSILFESATFKHDKRTFTVSGNQIFSNHVLHSPPTHHQYELSNTAIYSIQFGYLYSPRSKYPTLTMIKSQDYNEQLEISVCLNDLFIVDQIVKMSVIVEDCYIEDVKLRQLVTQIKPDRPLLYKTYVFKCDEYAVRCGMRIVECTMDRFSGRPVTTRNERRGIMNQLQFMFVGCDECLYPIKIIQMFLNGYCFFDYAHERIKILMERNHNKTFNNQYPIYDLCLDKESRGSINTDRIDLIYFKVYLTDNCPAGKIVIMSRYHSNRWLMNAAVVDDVE